MFERFILAAIIGALLYAWAGYITVDCSRVHCYNTGMHND